MAINNIIFDLGGVLLNLDFDKTFKAFAGLGVHDFQQYFQQSHSNPLFADLEMGNIALTAFYDKFRQATGVGATDVEIKEAWNAMLLDFRDASMHYLDSLKDRYRIFLLSNTNQIHLEAFREIHFNQYGNHGFDNHFEKAWYSHELGLRKPHQECYVQVLSLHGLQGAETLFVDDTLLNIEGAQKAGIKTLHLLKGQTIEEVMPAFLG
jgi:putative hydrolase of the HAD superfamily